MKSTHSYFFIISGSKPLLCYWNCILSRMHLLLSATPQAGPFELMKTAAKKQCHLFGWKTKGKYTPGTVSRDQLKNVCKYHNVTFPDYHSLNRLLLLCLAELWPDAIPGYLISLCRLNYTNASKNVSCYNDSVSNFRWLHENIWRAGCGISGWLIFIMQGESNLAWNNGFTGRGKWNIKGSLLLLHCMPHSAKLLL